MSRLTLVPVTLREANAFVKAHHRHLGPARGCRFCLGAVLEKHIVGVAIVSRPVARRLDDGWTAEVVRVATDGSRYAGSFLYGHCWRVARAMGYRRLVTYTLPEESGVTLRAVGWRLYGDAGGGPWARQGRPRVDLHPQQVKLRWEVAVGNSEANADA